MDVHRVDAAAAEAFGIGSDGAVPVRPDGRITQRWYAGADIGADDVREGVRAALRGGAPAYQA